MVLVGESLEERQLATEYLEALAVKGVEKQKNFFGVGLAWCWVC